MNPELAGEVIKKYLLPMFEADNRHILARGRAEVFGLRKDADQDELDITDYKLSDRLSSELKKTHNQLQSLDSKLGSTQDETDDIKEELYLLRMEYLKSTSELRSLEIFK
jgi:peptidoglycan hydrolase CwlO-like protein